MTVDCLSKVFYLGQGKGRGMGKLKTFDSHKICANINKAGHTHH
jgi:CRISPR/Cas system CSM-associated protein Csm3 (group 7 of RAMP superfamily)